MARRRVLLQRAADETQLRFGPEIRGLRQLLREAKVDLRVNLRAERGAAAGIQAAARAAMPDVRRIYTSAGHQAQQADADVAAALAGLGHGADSTRAVAATESAAAKTRLAEAFGHTESDLARRQVEAAAGSAYGQRAARAQYGQQVAKVRGQQQDLAQEAGLFASTTYQGLQDANAKLSLDKQRVKISLGNLRERQAHDRTLEGQGQQRIDISRQRAADKAAARKKNGGFTTIQLRDARAMWDKAKTYATELKKKGVLNEQSATQVALAIEKRGVKLPLAKAAVAVVLHGGVKPETRRRIHQSYGLKPKVHRGLLGNVQDTVGRLYG